MRFAPWSVLLLLPLAGCLDDDDEADDDAIVLPPGTPFSDYLHNLSATDAGLSYTWEHIRTPVPGPLGEESVELDTWILRPLADDPVPIVLEITPYYGGGQPTGFGRLGNELLPRGYAVGVSSVRGTGNSGGCFTQGGVTEARDSAAVIEHAAAQPWSSGDVGLIGVSYPGTTPQDVWVEAPPSLKAVVPISGISDLYKYNFVNGVHIDIQGLGFNTYYWLLVGLAPAGLSGGVSGNDVPSVPGAIAGEACTEQVDVQEGGVSSTLDGNKDAYWQERDFLAELQAAGPLADGRQRAAVWYIHGLQDWNVKPHMMEDWLDGVWAEGVPTKVWLGQWPHAWPAPTGADCDEEGASCRADWWSLGLVAWFDQFLKGMDTGILDAPAVQVQDDDGVWRSEDVWPAATDALRFYFDAGALRTDGPGSGSAEYTVATAVDVVVGTSVTFVSEPLEGDLHLSGLPLLRGNITASGDRASLVVSLGERGADGDRYVNFAAQSLNHVGDLAAGRDSVAGVTQDVSVRFFPQDDVLHAGNRILVTFAPNTAGGPGPGLIPIQDLGTITLDLASLRLVLPIDATIVAESEQPYVGLAVET